MLPKKSCSFGVFTCCQPNMAPSKKASEPSQTGGQICEPMVFRQQRKKKSKPFFAQQTCINDEEITLGTLYTYAPCRKSPLNEATSVLGNRSRGGTATSAVSSVRTSSIASPACIVAHAPTASTQT